MANGAGGAGNGRPGETAKARRALQTPSDAVLTEALSGGAGSAESNGGALASSVGEKLQRNVDEALDHAEE